MGRLPGHQLPRTARDRGDDGAPGEPPLGGGKSASVPGAAAIANAIFDATGVRFRAPPFTPERVRAALNPLPAPAGLRPGGRRPPARPGRPWRSLRPAARRLSSAWHRVSRGCALALGDRAGQLQRPAYSEATIERGRRLAALGDCAVCHTAPGGTPNAAAGRCRRLSAPPHHQPHARSRDRHRPLVLHGLPAGHARGHLARRPSPLPGLPVHRFAKTSDATCRRSTPTSWRCRRCAPRRRRPRSGSRSASGR